MYKLMHPIRMKQSFEERVDIHIIVTISGLFDALCDIFLFFNRHLLLKLFKVVLKFVLIVVHIVVSGEHLVHHIALHFHIEHFIVQIIHFVYVYGLHSFLLCLNCIFKPFVLYYTRFTISL